MGSLSEVSTFKQPLIKLLTSSLSSSHMVPSVEAQRGGQELDQWLFEGGHLGKTDTGGDHCPPLAVHHQRTQAQGPGAGALQQEDALFLQVCLALLLLLLLVPCLDCDFVI